MQSPTIGQLAAALAKAQAKIKGAVKDSANPFFKSSYADLQAVWDACREALTSNDLAVIQTTDECDRGTTLITTLAHKSGEYIQGKMPVLPLKTEPQALGSAISYARRYALAAIVGVYQTDDDGEAAQARPKNSAVASRPAPTPPSVEPPTPKASPEAAAEPSPMIAKKPFLDRIAKSNWNKEQLTTYSKATFGKSDSKAMSLAEVMKLAQTVTEKSFEQAMSDGLENEAKGATDDFNNFRG